MTPKRLYLVMIGVIILLFIGLIGGAYAVNNVLVSHANKLTSLKAKQQALVQEKISLNKAKKDIKKYAELNNIAKSVVPEDKDQAEAVREIVNIAAQNNVSLSAINFPASSLGNSAAGVATPAAGAKPVPVNLKTAGLSQLTPIKNIPGIYQLPITIVGDPNQPVMYDEFVGFLKALESNRRTAQVSSITISPDPKNHNLLTFTLVLNGYVKP